MSQFGAPTSQANPPFNSVNPAGTDPNQSIQTIAQVKQGQLNREHDARMQSAQLAQQAQQAYLQRQHATRNQSREMRFEFLRGEVQRRNEDFWKERSERLARDQMNAQRKLEAMRMRREDSRWAQSQDIELAREERTEARAVRTASAARQAGEEFEPEVQALTARKTQVEGELMGLEMLRQFTSGFMDTSEGGVFSQFTQMTLAELTQKEMLDRITSSVGESLSAAVRVPLTDRGERYGPPVRAEITSRMAQAIVTQDSPELRQEVEAKLRRAFDNAAFAAEDRQSNPTRAREARTQLAIELRNISEIPGVDPDALGAYLVAMRQWASDQREGTEAARLELTADDPSNLGRVTSRGAQDEKLLTWLDNLSGALGYTDEQGRVLLHDPTTNNSTASYTQMFQTLASAIAGNPQQAAFYLQQTYRDETGRVVPDPDFVEAVQDFFSENGAPAIHGGSGVSPADAERIAGQIMEVWLTGVQSMRTAAGSKDPFAGQDTLDVVGRWMSPEGSHFPTGGWEGLTQERDRLGREIEGVGSRTTRRANELLGEAGEESLRDIAEARRGLRSR